MHSTGGEFSLLLHIRNVTNGQIFEEEFSCPVKNVTLVGKPTVLLEFHSLRVSSLFSPSAVLDIFIAVRIYRFHTHTYVGKIVLKIGAEKNHLLTHLLSKKSRTSDQSKVFLISFRLIISTTFFKAFLNDHVTSKVVTLLRRRLYV